LNHFYIENTLFLKNKKKCLLRVSGVKFEIFISEYILYKRY